MANNGQKIDELFISLGLDLDQLDLDFVTADKTVQQSISRLNSEKNQVKIKTDIDLANLEGAGSEVDKLKTKEESLNRLLDIQKQKVSILSAVYKDAQQQYGNDNGLTRKAETNYLREEKAAAQLEAELRKLATARKEEEVASSRSSLIKQKMSNVSSGLETGVRAARDFAWGGMGAVSAGIIPKLGPVAIGAAALGGATFSIIEISKRAIEAGDVIYKLQLRLGATSEEAQQFSNIFKIGEVDVQAGTEAIIRLNKQLSGSGQVSSDAGRMLQQLGVSLKDEKGNLLPVNEELGKLAEAYQKASEKGMQQAFVAQVLGARGAELIPILQNYNEISEAAEKVKNPILNPLEAHKLADEWAQMDTQMKAAGISFSAALMPIAEQAIPSITSGIVAITDTLNNSQDAVKDFSHAAVTNFTAIKDVLAGIDNILNSIGLNNGAIAAMAGAALIGRKLPIKGGGLAGLGIGAALSFTDILPELDTLAKHDTASFDGVGIASALGGVIGALVTRSPTGAIVGSALAGGAATKLASWFNGSNGDSDKWAQQDKDQSDEQQKKLDELTDKLKQQEEAYKTASIEKENKKLDTQIDDTRFALANPNSPLEVRLHQEKNAIWEEAEAAKDAGADKAKAFELADLRIEKAEQDYAKAVRDANRQVSDSLYSLTHNDLDAAVHAAEEQAQVWREQGLNSTLITEEEEAKKAKIYRDFEENVASKIDAVWKSSLQNRLDDFDREKRAYIQKGIDEVKATQWAERQKSITIQEAAQAQLKDKMQYLEIVRNDLRDTSIPMDQRIQNAKWDVLQKMRENAGFNWRENITPQDVEVTDMVTDYGRHNIVRSLSHDELARRQGVAYFAGTTEKDIYNNDDYGTSIVRGADSSRDYGEPVDDYNENASNPVNNNTYETHNSQPKIEINNTVKVDNLMTPNSESMNYLVNTVSDSLNTAIKPLLGGDDNSY